MSKEKSIEATEVFSILSATINGANFDDLCDAAHRIVHIAGYHKQSEGEWLVSECPLTASKKVKCSECGYIEHRGPAWNISWGMHKYCPNCGAKMKGGAE